MTTKGYGGHPMDETGGMGIIAIGMALGNPVDDRDIFSVQPQVVTTVSAPKDNELEQQLPNGLVRTKSKKWALFGRSKSMRVKYSDRSPDQPSLPFNATVTRTISNSVISRDTLSESSREAYLPSRKPLERSLTAPGTSRSERPPQVPIREDRLQSHVCPAQTSNGSPETFSRDTFNQEPISREPLTQEPFLDVEIPSITMERYSVMFASLLERRSTTPILMRRQNTFEKFRTLEEDDGEHDSLQQEIPAFGRKKSVDRRLPPQLPSRLHHVQSSPNSSMDTYPAVPRTSNDVLADVVAKHSNEHSPAPHIVRLASVRSRNPRVPLKIQKSEDGRLQLRSKFHVESPKQGSTPTHQSKFDLSDSSDTYARQGKPCPSLCRQTGKTLSTEMDDASTAQDHGPKVANYTHTTGTHPSSINNSDGFSDDETDAVEAETEVIHDAVQVSIARQISVSRDQHRLLGPLRLHPVNGQCTPEAKSLMPRLIESRKDALSAVGKYQKRERVVMRRIGGV
ncbi:hypothetical protein E4U21_005844 [Claviceps maximensis]|nr:hypothetical protein E4U21_005844 [Claviceps maximensis]